MGLYLLTRQARRMHDSDENMTTYINLYRTVYAEKFTDNPMTEYMKLWIVSNEIKIGGNFVDFTAPDLQGVQYTLSEEIPGKSSVDRFMGFMVWSLSSYFYQYDSCL